MESERPFSRNPAQESWRTTFILTFQSLGIIYGDLSVSPLYVYRNTFAEPIKHSETNEEIYGVLSIVFWTLTMIPLLKYIFIVLRADDNGEGGTFALYSLLFRHIRGDTDEQTQNPRNPTTIIASLLKKHTVLQSCLLTVALIGASMVIADGVLTPALSVLSVVSGLEFLVSEEHHKYIELPIACGVLIALFFFQKKGTHMVSYVFAPVVLTWLICISGIGVYNILHWNPHVYQALNPNYIIQFLRKSHHNWLALSGILLSLTGSEAMYADLGHFSKRSIKIAFVGFVYPSLVLAYMGQAAYLSRHHVIERDYKIGFYVSVPEKLRWPVLAVALLAAVVASQAAITATFSIVKQCSAFGVFPRVKVINTSSRFRGQVHISEINWFLVFMSLAVTVGFGNTKTIGNASGLAVITVLVLTTFLMPLVMVVCWRWSYVFAAVFFVVFGGVESLFFSSAVVKFTDGAWFSVVLSVFLLAIMCVWFYGSSKKSEFESSNNLSISWITGAGKEIGLVRVRGVGVIYSDHFLHVPRVTGHLVTKLPALHRILIFLTIRFVPAAQVPPEERFLVGRITAAENRIYRCIVRYGYADVHADEVGFQEDLIRVLREFIQNESNHGGDGGASEETETMVLMGSPAGDEDSDQTTAVPGNSEIREVEERSPSPPRRIGSPDSDGFEESDEDTAVAGNSEMEESCITPPRRSGKTAAGGDFDESDEETAAGGDFDESDEETAVDGVAEMGECSSAVASRKVGKRVTFILPPKEMTEGPTRRRVREELAELNAEVNMGVVYILSHSRMEVQSGSGLLKKIVIEDLYNFLNRNFRGPSLAFHVPHVSTLEVGMVYQV